MKPFCGSERKNSECWGTDKTGDLSEIDNMMLTLVISCEALASLARMEKINLARIPIWSL